MAVGGSLAERWNGKRWSIERTPSHGGLGAVSCTSPTACTAVAGPYADSTLRPDPYASLIDRWNGARWSVQRAPTLPGGPIDVADVSCVSRNECMAVGYQVEGVTTSRYQELGIVVLGWNGVDWSLQPSPTLPASFAACGVDVPCGAELDGLSCISRHACIAVGGGGNTYQGLAASWNGESWTLSLSTPPFTLGSVDGSVSCISATDCTALFADDRMVRWNGGGWSAENFPDGEQPIYGVPQGISRATSKFCVAVGYIDNTHGCIEYGQQMGRHVMSGTEYPAVAIRS